MRFLSALSLICALVLSIPAPALAQPVALPSTPTPTPAPTPQAAGTTKTDTTGWFPLTLPWDDASVTAIDASDLLLDAPGDDPTRLIDLRGYVEARPDGHFYYAKTGRRAKFWGTNLVFSGAFPPSPDYPPESGEFQDARAAEKLAGRLAKLGFNAVRISVDAYRRPNGAWLNPDQNTQLLDPVQLGRLDYLVYQLKRHAIYVDLILRANRAMVLGDGVVDAPEFAASYIYIEKGASLYDPIIIALQKKFAHDIMGHVNPYTGMAYKDDPVMAFTETANEDSFGLAWAYDQLNNVPGDPHSFPAFSSQELDGWTKLSGKGPSINRLRNPGFESGTDGWSGNIIAPSQATLSAVSGGSEGSQALQVAVTKSDGVNWHVQLIQNNIALESGKKYRLSFAVRADANTTINGYIMRASDPWDTLGWAQQYVPVSTSWKTYSYEFTASDTVLGGARISFDLGQEVRNFWFDSFLLQEVDAFPGFNGWLEARYGSTAAVRSAWAPANARPQPELLSNASFESGMAQWSTQATAPSAATFSIDATTATSGTHSLKAEVTAVDGTAWHVQLYQSGFGLTAGQLYRLTFDARATDPTAFNASIIQNHSPYQALGLGVAVTPSAGWQSFSFDFKATATDADAHLSFDLGQKARTLWLDNVSLKLAPAMGLLPGESLEAANILRIRRSEASQYTPRRLRDTLRFYDETQRAFFTGMHDYLRTAIGSHALNTGTQSYIDSLMDVATMAQLDFVDNHRYWDHPYWDGKPAWSSTGWFITNQAWINAPFVYLYDLATTAVKGKPFTVTEFYEVFPNRQQVEGPLLVAAFGNLQDWDGIFEFDYSGDQLKYSADHPTTFFDLTGNPVMTGVMPLASRLFLGQQTTSAPAMSTLSYTRDERYDSALSGWAGSVATYLMENKKVERAAGFGSRLRIDDFVLSEPVTPTLPTPSGPVYTSAGGQLKWDTTVQDGTGAVTRALVTVDAPAVQAALGFMNGRSVSLGNLSVDVPASETAFSLVMAQSRDGLPLATSSNAVLGVFTRMENTGQIWNDAQTSLDDHWGGAPTLVEPVRMTVTIKVNDPARVQVWVLDEKGALQTRVATSVPSTGKLRFLVDTNVQKTMWYALVRGAQSYLPLNMTSCASTGVMGLALR